MSRYIHELPDWPSFKWSQDRLASPLAALRHRQGCLIGRMETLGLPLRAEANLRTLFLEVMKSSGDEAWESVSFLISTTQSPALCGFEVF